jgi:hypothetical protein
MDRHALRTLSALGLLLLGSASTSGCLELGTSDGSAEDSCWGSAECVPAAPEGWTPVWVIEKDYPTALPLPACPDGSASTLRYAVPVTGGLCGPCTCQYTGGTCSAPTAVCYMGGPTCTGSSVDVAPAADVCTNLSTPMALAASCKMDKPSELEVQGTCEGTQAALLNVEPWAKLVLSCAAASEQACEGGVCRPPGSGGFNGARICVEKPGSDACPAGYTEKQIDAYDNGIDTRACSKCGCDPASVPCTGGSVAIFDYANCQVAHPNVTLTSPTECVSTPDYFDEYGIAARGTRGTPGVGVCTPAVATGAFEPVGARRICCR